MFEDRADAGRRLGQALEEYRGEDALVLGIPRGGVEVGIEVAAHLNVDFSILIVRKLPFPRNPESGFGAIAEDGSMYLYEEASRWLPEEAIQAVIREQQHEVQRRVAVLRGGPLPRIAGRTVILVDDGIAMGSTMRAGVMLCKNRDAGEIVVAAPVAGHRVVADFEALVDDVVVVEQPPNFRAVAQVYRNWYDVSDEEVLELMDAWREKQRS